MNEDQHARVVLIVDDEPSIVEVVSYALHEAGFRTLVATDGPTALRMGLTEHPSLVLLDVMLPGLDGLTVCRELRAASDVPIVLLTARGSESDRVMGLELQADDYIVKPFSVRELVARIRTILRRTGSTDTQSAHPPTATLTIGGLRLDADSCQATWNDWPIALTRLQFDLLSILARHPRMVFPRAQLLQDVWGQDFTDDLRTVDSMIKRLRSRLRDAGAPPEIIASRRDLGYCLDLAAATPSG